MGKAKQRRAGAAEQSSPESEVMVAPRKHAADAPVVQGSLSVGGEAEVTSHYLDMERVADDDGLPHAGYLVLQRGEKLRILYIGSVDTGDQGWIFAEVLLSLCAEPVGRRGWLPAEKVQPLPALPQPSRSVVEPQPRECHAAAASRSNLGQGGHSTAKAPNVVARSGKPHPCGQPGSNEMEFPALSPCGKKRFEQSFGPEATSPSGKPALISKAPAPEEAAALIARQRAAAAKAAASAVAKGDPRGEQSCPICMEKYAVAGHRRTNRPCCGVELCLKCDHKSLRSKRCYFCREDSDDFPSLGLACRVSIA